MASYQPFPMKPFLCLILGVLCLTASASAQRTRLLSFDASGDPSSEVQPGVALSANGQHVVYVMTMRVLRGQRWVNRDQIAVVDRITGRVRIASSNSLGRMANEDCDAPTISAGGRFVGFASISSNLHPASTRLTRQIFVKDMVSGEMLLASTDTSGVTAINGGEDVSISSKGGEVAFTSYSNNLAVGDTNNAFDVFIKVLRNDRIRFASVSSSGVQGNRASRYPTLSPDGDSVAFVSWADNLVANDLNDDRNLFLHDSRAGITQMVDVDVNGLPGNCLAQNEAAVNWGGRFVAFTAHDGLAPSDTNQKEDILLRDIHAGVTSVISVTSQGVAADGDSRHPSMSPDGRFIAFVSDATNLDPTAPLGWDAYVHDRLTGETRRVSTPEVPGTNGGGVYEETPWVSANGQVVAFASPGDQILENDPNGAARDVLLHGGPELTVSSTCPGPFTATVRYLRPNTRVGLIFGERNYVHLRRDSICPDLLLDVRVLPAVGRGFQTALSDAAGVAQFQGTYPVGACGVLYAQAIEISTCLASNPAPL